MNAVHIYTPHYEDYALYGRPLTESNLEKRIDELHDILSEKKPDVFVSHKSDDKDTATEVARTIAKCGLTAYLDAWDSNVNGDGPELVDYINAVIGHCKSLIAVVSHNTVRSWWVPLEIGIAITKGLHLGTFCLGYRTRQNLPSYLWKWPVLKNMEDLKNWCKEREKGTPVQVFYESLKEKHPNMFEQ